MNIRMGASQRPFFGLWFRLALCLTIGLAAFPPTVNAQTIFWYGEGNPGNNWTLRQDQSGQLSSLFPVPWSGNTVLVNGDVSGTVFGGCASSAAGVASATGNSVSVSGGTIIRDVHGGYAETASGTASATGNSVSVSGGTITMNVYGGLTGGTGTGKATGNSVSISGGTIIMDVYGGYAKIDTGAVSATGNSVSVSGGTIAKSVYGGSTYTVSGTASATGNSVSVSGGTITMNVYGGYALNYLGAASATGNSVSVSGGTITEDVYGGHAKLISSGAASATGNSVSVSGGTIGKDVHGGYALSDTGAASATGNSVSVSGGTIGKDVHGGYAETAGAASATGNSVSVSGGTITRDVYGGYALSAADAASATGNTVTLSGAPVFGVNSALWGGFALVMATNNGDGFTGNTLNIWNYSGSAVQSVQNFQYYNFILPASLQSGGTLLTVTGAAYFDGSAQNNASPSYNSVSTITGVNIMGGGTAPQAGDSVTLIYAANGITGTAVNGNSPIQGRKGVSLLYDWQLAQDTSSLTATVTGMRVNPQTKALSEGRLAGLILMNQAGDLVAGPGILAALRGGDGLSAFTAAQGGKVRHTTNSHVDVSGFSLMTGLAWNTRTDSGKLMLGAFFEAGWGNYDSYNSFSGSASVEGEGDTKYYGGGVMGRFEYPLGRTERTATAQRSTPATAFAGKATARAAQDARPSVIYTEASLRAGWSETDFSSNDLRDPIGQKADYDSGSAYYGAHIGLGYIWNISDAAALDFSTKYFWTRQEGDSVSVVGDPVRFKDADSHRWRGGTRYSHTLPTEGGHSVTPYIGAAYEYEFDGKAGATTYGYSIDAPDLKGGTGIGEIGLTFRPAPSRRGGPASGFSIDLGVQGHTGVREGVTGTVQMKLEF